MTEQEALKTSIASLCSAEKEQTSLVLADSADNFYNALVSQGYRACCGALLTLQCFQPQCQVSNGVVT